MGQRRHQRRDGACEVHVEDLMPQLPVKVLDRNRWRQDASICEYTVEWSQLPGERIDRGAKGLSIRYVGETGFDSSTVSPNRVNCEVQGSSVLVDPRDDGPLRRCEQRRRPTNAAPDTRD